MLKEDIFLNVATSVLLPDPSPEKALLCMMALHMYNFQIQPNLELKDAGERHVLAPLTRRHAAEIVAAVLKNSSLSGYDPVHWYYKYDELTPFEMVTEVSEPWRKKLDSLISQIKKNENIINLSED